MKENELESLLSALRTPLTQPLYIHAWPTLFGRGAGQGCSQYLGYIACRQQLGVSKPVVPPSTPPPNPALYALRVRTPNPAPCRQEPSSGSSPHLGHDTLPQHSAWVSARPPPPSALALVSAAGCSGRTLANPTQATMHNPTPVCLAAHSSAHHPILTLCFPFLYHNTHTQHPVSNGGPAIPYLEVRQLSPQRREAVARGMCTLAAACWMEGGWVTTAGQGVLVC